MKNAPDQKSANNSEQDRSVAKEYIQINITDRDSVSFFKAGLAGHTHYRQEIYHSSDENKT